MEFLNYIVMRFKIADGDPKVSGGREDPCPVFPLGQCIWYLFQFALA